MTGLARRTGSVNLGQGFPDFDPPQPMLDAAAAALHAGHHQYAPIIGVPALREAIAAHQGTHYGLDLDPDTDVLVCAGATAVSYTHLDVYKRQQACFGDHVNLQPEAHSSFFKALPHGAVEQADGWKVLHSGKAHPFQLGQELRHQDEPVSYTHLDVYKRQGGQ